MEVVPENTHLPITLKGEVLQHNLLPGFLIHIQLVLMH